MEHHFFSIIINGFIAHLLVYYIIRNVCRFLLVSVFVFFWIIWCYIKYKIRTNIKIVLTIIVYYCLLIKYAMQSKKLSVIDLC